MHCRLRPWGELVVELHHIYVVLYTIAAILASVVVLVAWKRRTARGARAIAAVMLGVAIWSAATAVRWYVPTLGQQVFWLNVENLGVWMVPVGFLALALEIAGIERWRTPARIALISITLFVLVNIEWLNPRRLFDTAFVAIRMGSYTHYESVPGPLFWVFIAFAYTLIVVSLVIIFRVYLRSSGSQRRQAAILLIGGSLPLVASVVTQSKYVPLGYLDLEPLAFLATGSLWLAAILRGSLLDVLPLARGVLVEQMLDGVVVVSDGHVVDANPTALAMLRARLDDVLGETAETVFEGVAGATDVLASRGPGRAVVEFGANGDSRYVNLATTPLATGAGTSTAQLITLHDVTEERRVNERLQVAGRVFDSANEAIVVTLLDEDDRIIDVNAAFCRLTGRSREDTLGTGARSLRSTRHPPEFFRAVDETLQTTGQWQGEVWQTRADGSDFPSWLSLSMVEDDTEHMRHVVRVFTDITEIKQAEERLRHNATHDALTGLPNRVLFDDRLEHALAHCRRADSGLAVLFIDLDDFKNINDTLGHARGDELLVEVASRIVTVVRESDTAARFGGDEFAIVVGDIENPAQIEVMSLRLLQALASPYRLGDQDMHVTASIGVALFPADGADATTLMQHADLAMYGAKRAGSNRIKFFSAEFQQSLNRRTKVEKELWAADEEERFFVLYQPQVDLSTGRIVGAEALVRLRGLDGTVVMPEDFIHVAESSELIFRIGDWVLRRACADLSTLHQVDPDLIVSVNFSARQFTGIDVTSLQNVLRASSVGACSLAIELTETALLDDPSEAANRLADLRDVAGLRLSLDDFGTGDSSLTFVRMFKADTIKIDRSFIELLPNDPEARAIVMATIALAKSFHATVIAEGPETEEQVRFLRANGCDAAQGFYFSPPIPADELALLMRAEPFSLPEITAVST